MPLLVVEKTTEGFDHSFEIFAHVTMTVVVLLACQKAPELVSLLKRLFLFLPVYNLYLFRLQLA